MQGYIFFDFLGIILKIKLQENIFFLKTSKYFGIEIENEMEGKNIFGFFLSLKNEIKRSIFEFLYF